MDRLNLDRLINFNYVYLVSIVELDKRPGFDQKLKNIPFFIALITMPKQFLIYEIY